MKMVFYLKEYRPQLINPSNESNWLLLNDKGNQTKASFLFEKIKKLTKEAGIKKDIGLHTLRHYIDTHLLQ